MKRRKVACVGDSITFGYGSSDPETRSYPAHLQGLLGDDFLVGNFGLNGATTLSSGDLPYIRTEQYKLSQEYEPDIVILMLGTNDSKPMNWKGHEGDYKKDAIQLIQSYLNLPSKPVLYMATSPTAWYPEDEQYQGGTITPETVEKIVPIQYEISKEEKVILLDMFDFTKDKKEFFPDGVHPNDEGFALIANFIYSNLKNTL